MALSCISLVVAAISTLHGLAAEQTLEEHPQYAFVNFSQQPQVSESTLTMVWKLGGHLIDDLSGFFQHDYNTKSMMLADRMGSGLRGAVSSDAAIKIASEQSMALVSSEMNSNLKDVSHDQIKVARTLSVFALGGSTEEPFLYKANVTAIDVMLAGSDSHSPTIIEHGTHDLASGRPLTSLAGGSETQEHADLPMVNLGDTRSSWIQQRYNDNPPQYVTAESFSSQGDFLIMSSSAFWTAQTTWRTDSSSAKSWVQDRWSDGYSLTGFTYGMYGYWAATMTKGAGIGEGSWRLRQDIPSLKEAIADRWGAGHRILDVSYGDGQWMLVTGVCDEMAGAQAWQSSNDYSVIRDFIRQKWNEDYYVTSVAKGGDTYFVSMTQNSNFQGQSYAWKTATDLSDYVNGKWNAGYRITGVLDDYDKDPNLRYLVVMSQVSNSQLYPNSGVAQSYHAELGW